MKAISLPGALLCLVVASVSGLAPGQSDGGGKGIAPSKVRCETCLRNPEVFCLLAEAISLTREIRSDYSRASGLVKIAQVQARVGRKREARASLAEALDIALRKEWDKDVPPLLLWSIQESLASLGDVDVALTLTERMDDRYKSDIFRAVRLAVIARGQFAGGDEEGAHQTLQNSFDLAHRANGGSDRDRAQSWMIVAEVSSDFGVTGKAQEAVAQATDILSRGKTARDSPAGVVFDLLWLLELQSQLGIQRETRQLLARLHDAARQVQRDERAEAQGSLARAYAMTGHWRAALNTTRGIADPEQRTRALSHAAQGLAKAGKQRESARLFENAINTARAISNPDRQATALAIVSGGQVKAGQRRDATRLLESVVELAVAGCSRHKEQSIECGRSALRITLREQLQMGNLRAAVAVARQMKMEPDRVVGLVSVARVQAKNGGMQEARQTLQEALAFALAAGRADKQHPNVHGQPDDLTEMGATAMIEIASGWLDLGDARPR